VLGVLMLGANFATAMLGPAAQVLFTQELGWSDTEYAQLFGGPGLLIGLAGAVLGGLLADRVGHRRLAAIAAIAMAGAWVVFALAAPWWTSRAFILAVFWIHPLCLAVMTVSLFALCMDVSWPRIAATQFTAYMALGNLSSTRGYQFAGDALAAWGYQGVYLVAAGIQLALTCLLLLIDPHQTRRVLDGESAPPRQGRGQSSG
jgi:MFS transporter, PAT family, beta-lactamase induction signal transducer AmpG